MMMMRRRRRMVIMTRMVRTLPPYAKDLPQTFDED